MAGRFCGQSDPELNDRGRQQLAGLANMLSDLPIDRVYTSDLRRARQTAEAIAEHLCARLHVRPGLREIHFGRWETLSWNEIEDRDPALARGWAQEYPKSTAPGGESFRQFELRVLGEIAFLLAEAKKSPIAAVTHAGFVRVVLTNWCRMPEQEAWDRTKEYGSIVTLDSDLIRREGRRR